MKSMMDPRAMQRSGHLTLRRVLRFALLLTLALAANPARSRADDELRVIMALDYPPFTYYDKSGAPSGFEVEFANAICAVLKRPCKFINTPFEDVIPALLAGRGDVIISSFAITEERKKKVDFTIPYLKSPLQFVARRGYSGSTTADGLKGRRIGVSAGSMHEAYARRMFPGAEIVPVPGGLDENGQSSVFGHLANGDVDIVLINGLVAWYFIASGEGKAFTFVGSPIYDVRSVGIALRKGDDALRQKLDSAIVEIRADGTYKKINAKYFPFRLDVSP